MAIGVIFPALCLADKATLDGPFPLKISAKPTANPSPQAIMAGGVITLGEMRAKGMTMLEVACRRCDRRGRLRIDRSIDRSID